MGLERTILAAVHGLGVDYSGRSPWARSGVFCPQSMGLEWIILVAVHGHGVDYSGRSPWARSGLFWPQSMGTERTSPGGHTVSRGMPRHYACGNESKSCFLSSIQAIMALGLAMTTDMASMAAR